MTTTTANGMGLRGPSRVLTALASALAGFWNAYMEQRRRKANEAMLRALDDRTLKDIGLDRSEIGSLFVPGSRDRLFARRVQPVQLRNL
ncbi:MAG: DUF1127 domain-containing protein [Hyphomicrobiales bacterium]